jgi:hypothetical protein
VQPSRVAKQMVSMFLALRPQLYRARWAEAREFVLRRDRRIAGFR